VWESAPFPVPTANSQQPVTSTVDFLTIRDSRINIRQKSGSSALIVCIGALNMGEPPGNATIGSITIEDSEIGCAAFGSGGTGIGTGTPVSLSVSGILLRKAIVTCDLPDGACVGTSAAIDGGLNISGGRISALAGAGIAARDSTVIVNGSSVECDSWAQSCVQADGLEVQNFLTGRTNAVRYFDVAQIRFPATFRLLIKYFNTTVAEGLTEPKFLHLGGIRYGAFGPYTIHAHGTEVAMDGSEEGVLISLPAAAVAGVTHRAVRSYATVFGPVLTAEGAAIVFANGETMVTDPKFVALTGAFTNRIDYYHRRGKIIRGAYFLFMLWP
jgi:hypothetical protein